ncbi:MAG: DUF1295 domain-containing protein [Spirochaetota bacterium]
MIMKKEMIQSFVGIAIAIIIGAGLAWAGSQHNTVTILNIPIFAFLLLMAFFIQWIAFIPSYLLKTEKFYDLTGSLTYISLILFALIKMDRYDIRSLVLTVLVLIWAFRLGIYLFKRILTAGQDTRFTDIKQSAIRLLLAWTLQALWISFTAGAAFAAITSAHEVTMNIFDMVGVIVWLIGFGCESIADLQKSKFNANPQNRGKFINIGLWSISRHPNYFGEIVIWIGIAIISFQALEGARYITLLSPVFVALLITQISGLPILEKLADERWGGQAEYEEYKLKTPVLIPTILFKKRG